MAGYGGSAIERGASASARSMPDGSMPGETGSGAVDRAGLLEELEGRIRGMQRRTLGSGGSAPVVPVAGPLSGLFPSGGLAPGSVYLVPSVSLVLLLVAEASSKGEWVAVVGVPDLSAEAVDAAGVARERLVVVPHPGDQAVRVAATLGEVMGLVVLGPVSRIAPAERERVEARLRARGTVLLVLGGWPSPAAEVRMGERAWSGLGRGHGHLAGWTATVSSRGRDGRVRRVLTGQGDDLAAERTPMSAVRDLIEHTDE